MVVPILLLLVRCVAPIRADRGQEPRRPSVRGALEPAVCSAAGAGAARRLAAGMVGRRQYRPGVNSFSGRKLGTAAEAFVLL